jgi:copper chaperone NosL
MRPSVAKSNRFLQAPLGVAPRILLLLAALLLVLTYVLPLWDMTMFAPQYGGGLRLHIYSHELVGGNGGQDLKEINLLNHYIGMHELTEQSFTEFLWMPFIIGALGLLFLRAAVFGTIGHLVDVTVMFVYFGLFSLYSFAHKLWVYGHELAPDAAVKVPGFMPPAIGGKQIANFEVYSYPGAGAYAFVAVGLALVAALAVAWRTYRRTRGAAVEGGVGAGAEGARPLPGA